MMMMMTQKGMTDIYINKFLSVRIAWIGGEWTRDAFLLPPKISLCVWPHTTSYRKRDIDFVIPDTCCSESTPNKLYPFTLSLQWWCDDRKTWLDHEISNPQNHCWYQWPWIGGIPSHHQRVENPIDTRDTYNNTGYDISYHTPYFLIIIIAIITCEKLQTHTHTQCVGWVVVECVL